MNEPVENEFAAAYRGALARRREAIASREINDVEQLSALRQELWDDQVEIGRRYVVPSDLRRRIQTQDLHEIGRLLRERWPPLYEEAFPLSPNMLESHVFRARGPFPRLRFRLWFRHRRLRRRIAG